MWLKNTRRPKRTPNNKAKKSGKSPKGNSWTQVEAVARKIGGAKYADSTDTLMSADVYIRRAKKAGKTDAEIAKMTKAQLMKL